MTLVTWILPIKTISEANTSEHWTKKAKRRKQQAFLVRYMFNRETTKIELPCDITLTRLAPRMLDPDNLPCSMKSVQDEIADILVPEKGGWYRTKKGVVKRIRGHADGDPRLTWHYGQEKWKTQAVKLEMRF